RAAVPAAAAPATLFSAASRLFSAFEAKNVPAAAAPALDFNLARTYDGSRDIKEGLPALVEDRFVAAANAEAPRLAPSALSHASAPSDVEPPSAAQGPAAAAPAATSHARVAVGLGLAALGAVAAFFTAPAVVAFAGGLLAAHLHVVAGALTLKGVWISVGTLAGFAAFHTETWKGFPGDVANSAVTAAGTTFRFWARFGMIFNGVLRAGSTDAASKAALPLNVLDYPIIAWPAVLVGYVFAPAAFVLGAGYQLVATPVVAGIRGAREVLVGFFPWLSRVLRFLGRLIVRGAPFVLGFTVGSAKTFFISGAAGAAALAGPVIRDAAEDYESRTLPGKVMRVAMIVVGYASALVLGALGFVVGAVSSPLTILFGGLQKAFDWSNVSPSANTFFKRWWTALHEDKGLNDLVDRRFPATKAENMGTRIVRVANGIVLSAVEAAALPIVSQGSFIRAVYAAAKGADTPAANSSFGDGVITGAKERPVAETPGAVLPIVLAVVGAAALTYGATFAVSYLFLEGLWALGAYAVAAAAGIGLGLAASQPAAFRTTPSDVVDGTIDGGRLGFGGWTNLGARVFKATAGQDAEPIGEVLGAIPGSVATLPSAVLGGAYELAAALVKASWTGLKNALGELLPLLIRVARRAAPYVAGLIVGTVVAALKNLGFGAISALRPFSEIYQRESAMRTRRSKAQSAAVVLLTATLAAPILAVGVAGAVLGAIVGIPFAVTSGFAQAGHWAKVGPKSEDFYKNWNERFLPRVADRVASANRNVFRGTSEGLPVWRTAVRAANALLGAAPAALTMIATAVVASFDGEETVEKPLASDYDAPKAEASAPSAPSKRTPTIVVALAGVAGLALGLYAGAYVIAGLAALTATAALIGLPFFDDLNNYQLAAGYLAAFGAMPILGAATGFALSQRSFWKTIIPKTVAQAKAGAKLTYRYWSNSGEAAVAAVADAPRGPSLFALPHKAVGVAQAVPFAAAGGVVGASAAFGRSALDGARQIVDQFLPFLRWVWRTAVKVVRHSASFVFGLGTGLVSGAVGSAAFGTLLLGRPYFKNVVTAETTWNGALGFLGIALLKTMAGLAGIVLGALGAVAGIVLAAPYALTSAFAFAFRFSGIGGPIRTFLDHWTYGALPQELKRINQLTDKFQFPDGDVTASAGWIRMANILPATLAATVAGTIAGLVSWFRSLKNAYIATRDGQKVPVPNYDADPQWHDTWRSSEKAARSVLITSLSGAALGLTGWLFGWAPLGFAGWFLVGTLAALGATASLTVAGGLAAIGLLYWIGSRLK
ncbi:MAG: hypothetical protein ACHQ49_17770, partial [Elusimicrobiota bacterium]